MRVIEKPRELGAAARTRRVVRHFGASSAGFSLLEVLIAVVVFSIGLLGAAMLATSSVKNSHNAYLRSQASLLADSMVERMRANPAGVWSGDYAGTLASGGSLPSCGAGSPGSGCQPADVAGRDRTVIGGLVAAQLPNGAGKITCATSGDAGNNQTGIAPVNGSCTIQITWAERRDVDDKGYGGTQMFELVVQP